jgi:hypothetical protein
VSKHASVKPRVNKRRNYRSTWQLQQLPQRSHPNLQTHLRQNVAEHTSTETLAAKVSGKLFTSIILFLSTVSTEWLQEGAPGVGSFGLP